MPITAFIYANIILFAMAVAPMLMKGLSLSLNGYQIAFLVSFVALVISTFILVFQNNLTDTIRQSFDVKIFFLIFMVGFLSFLDFFAYGQALQKGAQVAILLGYVRIGGVIFTAILGYLMFKEKLDWLQVTGIALSCIGLFLVLYKWK